MSRDAVDVPHSLAIKFLVLLTLVTSETGTRALSSADFFKERHGGGGGGDVGQAWPHFNTAFNSFQPPSGLGPPISGVATSPREMPFDQTFSEFIVDWFNHEMHLTLLN